MAIGEICNREVACAARETTVPAAAPIMRQRLTRLIARGHAREARTRR